MKGTFTIPSPSGLTKVRIGSQRRYVVLSWRRWGTNPEYRWVPEFRSDNLVRARSKAWGSAEVILDTETGEIVR